MRVLQVMVPGETETWGDSNDPEDNDTFPVCTVKLFPSEIAHTIHWAKESFELKFCNLPTEMNKLVGERQSNGRDMRARISGSKDTNMFKTLQRIDKLLSRQPSCFDDCIVIARRKFDNWCC